MKQSLLHFATLLIALLLPAAVLADNVKIGDIYYTLTAPADGQTTGTAVVARSEGSNDVAHSVQDVSGDIVIPATVEHGTTTYTVVEVGVGAFMNLTGITSVVFPNTIKSIGSTSFLNCTGLKSISFLKTGRT